MHGVESDCSLTVLHRAVLTTLNTHLQHNFPLNKDFLLSSSRLTHPQEPCSQVLQARSSIAKGNFEWLVLACVSYHLPWVVKEEHFKVMVEGVPYYDPAFEDLCNFSLDFSELWSVDKI